MKCFYLMKVHNITVSNHKIWKLYLEISRVTSISRDFIFLDLRRLRLNLACCPHAQSSLFSQLLQPAFDVTSDTPNNPLYSESFKLTFS